MCLLLLQIKKSRTGSLEPREEMLAFATALVMCMLHPTSGVSSSLREFAAAWSKIQAYTATLVMHETVGTSVQDRTYDCSFTKPHAATIVISGGPGKGGREVWTGGDTVIASPPGLLSRLRLHLSIRDARVVTLRGDTIAMASFAWLLQHLREKVQLSQSPGPSIGGNATTQLSLTVADATRNGGITREVVDFSTATRLPVRVLRFVGSTLVKQIDFRNVKVQR